MLAIAEGAVGVVGSKVAGVDGAAGAIAMEPTEVDPPQRAVRDSVVMGTGFFSRKTTGIS